jgi:hypothetical protein
VGETRPRADVDLAELRQRGDGQALRLGEDGGCLVGAAEVAGVDRVERNRFERARERSGVVAAVFVQGAIGEPLPALLAIPVGFGVTREENRGSVC